MSRDLFGQDAPEPVRREGLIELELHLHRERPLSLLVSLTGDRDKARLLPKSQIEFERKGASTIVKVSLPEWLALREGLV